MERDVLLAERILLQTLGFDLNITHPYQYFRQIIGSSLKGTYSASLVRHRPPQHANNHTHFELIE
jgi:hypothetical protein